MKIICKIFNTAKHVNLQLQRLQQPPVTFHTIKTNQHITVRPLLQVTGLQQSKELFTTWHLGIHSLVTVSMLTEHASTPLEFKHHSISRNTRLLKPCTLFTTMHNDMQSFLTKSLQWIEINSTTVPSSQSLGSYWKFSKNCLWFQCFCMVL